MIVSCRVRWAMQELCYMSIIRQTKVILFKKIGNKCLFFENFHFFNLLRRWSISAQSTYYVVQTFYRTQNPAQLIATISSISILAHPAKNSLTQIDNAVALRARSAIICRRVGHRGVTGTKDRPSESVPAKNHAPPSQQSVKQMTVRARDTTQRFQRHSDELQIIPFNKHQFSNYQFCFHGWGGCLFEVWTEWITLLTVIHLGLFSREDSSVQFYMPRTPNVEFPYKFYLILAAPPSLQNSFRSSFTPCSKRPKQKLVH